MFNSKIDNLKVLNISTLFSMCDYDKLKSLKVFPICTGTNNVYCVLEHFILRMRKLKLWFNLLKK